MKQSPNVSIIIPCYNAERWISATVESCLNQSYSDFEIIVSDDGSTDDSVLIVARLASEHPEKVRSIAGRNGGPSAAQNRGLAISRGKWIQYLGADDLLHPHKLSLSFRALEAAGPKAADVQFVWMPLEAVPEHFVAPASLLDEPPGIEERFELRSDALAAAYAPATALFRRSFLCEVGQWDETLRRWVDLEYHARIAALEPKFLSLDCPMYFYRQHSGARISSANSAYTHVEEGALSLAGAHRALASSSLPAHPGRTWLFPFYLSLARAYAAAGNEKEFRRCLLEASRLRGMATFAAKSMVAIAVCMFVGPKITSVLMERILPK